MFSKKLGLALGGVIFFLTAVAFIIGHPQSRDKRLYPIIKKYIPYKVENSLGGLRILSKKDPNFKEEPDAVNFYKRLQELESNWAKKHLKVSQKSLEILGDDGKLLEQVELKSESEKKFLKEYFGVGQ
jgi:hypothetical protein